MLTTLAVLVPLGELSSVSVCPARSVSTIRNQRYHIHANLSCAVLLAQVLLLASFQFSPATVSATPGCCWGLGPRGGEGYSMGGLFLTCLGQKMPSCYRRQLLRQSTRI